MKLSFCSLLLNPLKYTPFQQPHRLLGYVHQRGGQMVHVIVAAAPRTSLTARAHRQHMAVTSVTFVQLLDIALLHRLDCLLPLCVQCPSSVEDHPIWRVLLEVLSISGFVVKVDAASAQEMYNGAAHRCRTATLESVGLFAQLKLHPRYQLVVLDQVILSLWFPLSVCSRILSF